jgi:hypothetical protein
MLGPSLLIAPVSVEGATSRTVYLPTGSSWTDVHSGVSYQGGQQITAAAPLDTIPVFARSGAIIPQGPIKQYVSQTVVPGISVDFYPGPNSAFTMYEDDGNSFNYKTGTYLETAISRSSTSSATSIAIRRAAGTYTPAARPIVLLLHDTLSASGAKLNGTSLSHVANIQALSQVASGWAYDSTAQLTAVKIQDSAQPITVSVLP